jgi:hypothetical protein
MSTHIASESIAYSSDPAEQFLHDLNVLLDFCYADPQRPLLKDLAPQFAFHADLPLGERIVASYEPVRLSVKGDVFRQTVSEALKRCANAALGLDRSLLVIEIAHSICPESFSDEIWGRLMLRQKETEQPQWLRALAIRLLRWDIHVSMPTSIWLRVIRIVHPTGFEPLVRWGIHQSTSDHANGKFAIWLIAQARHVLSDHASQFLAEEVDVQETALALDESEDLLCTSYSHTSPVLEPQAKSEDSRLRAELQRQLGSSGADPGLYQTPANNRPVVAGPTLQAMA